MYKFPLFQSHLDLAHLYWKKLLIPKDKVIDATCGNGFDTVELAKLCLEGKVYAIDILSEALENTKKRLQEYPFSFPPTIQFIKSCHSQFPVEIEPETIKLIVYNLGYLPGLGNKDLTTKVETTISSLKNAIKLVQKGGAICITLYPGHEEGLLEQQKILEYIQELSPKIWNICYHQWPNKNKSPALLLLQKCNVV